MDREPVVVERSSGGVAAVAIVVLVIVAILAVFALGGLDILRTDTTPRDDGDAGGGAAPTIAVPTVELPTVAPGGRLAPSDGGLNGSG